VLSQLRTEVVQVLWGRYHFLFNWGLNNLGLYLGSDLSRWLSKFVQEVSFLNKLGLVGASVGDIVVLELWLDIRSL
jgi:hypothetical protein